MSEPIILLQLTKQLVKFPISYIVFFRLVINGQQKDHFIRNNNMSYHPCATGFTLSFRCYRYPYFIAIVAQGRTLLRMILKAID